MSKNTIKLFATHSLTMKNQSKHYILKEANHVGEVLSHKHTKVGIINCKYNILQESLKNEHLHFTFLKRCWHQERGKLQLCYLTTEFKQKKKQEQLFN